MIVATFQSKNRITEEVSNARSPRKFLDIGYILNLAIEMILMNQFEYGENGDDDGLREL